ncbi:unnamed protein product [Linum trigynum]|uniref:Sas10 C-terminal domain-containing protein n=1 Tax=Linum trigynum TaxID=586398 RepID=A0AAV2CB84_9ROSI
MGKKSGSQKKGSGKPKSSSRHKYANPEDMDDEIDVFHKQRDIVPLDLNDDSGESSDEEHPVFEDEDIKDVSDDEDEDDDVEDYGKDTGLAAKIVRQMKYLKEKMPGIDDEMQDSEEDEEENRSTWAGHKSFYHGGDNRDIEPQSSDEELQEEEEEVKRQQELKAKSLSMTDFGLEDVEDGVESDQELSLEQIKAGVKPLGKAHSTEPNLKEADKDLRALSQEEQMNAVYSSAPELVGLLSELNDALEQLETRINPVLSKAKESGIHMEGGLRFLEANQLLLLAYCQAITFYLLLKSEGLPVNDHPVIARLVELKGLLDKMKQLDGELPSKLEEFLKENISPEDLGKFMKKDAAPLLAVDLVTKKDDLSLASADTREVAETIGLVNGNSLSDHPRKELKEGRHKRKNDEVGVESTEMLRIRAALEEKLKQKGVFSFVASEEDKVKKKHKQANSRLETCDDFDDDAVDLKNGHHGAADRPTNLYSKKLKVVSGDEDIPKRDDIGERRRKHELRVLATAGVRSEDNAGDEDEFDQHVEDGDASPESEEESDAEGSEDESEEEANDVKDVKPVTAKAEKRNAAAPYLPEPVDGKRLITYQMEKNRGLTRKRKKLIKNPRKKYRVKHQSAEKRRKGQVVSIKKPTGPYGGEVSGINPGVSRSIRM